jgi:hypothetical protein
MPTIIVQATWPEGLPSGATLVERVGLSDLQDEHYVARLVERLRWALSDVAEPVTDGADPLMERPEIPSPTTPDLASQY